MGLKAYKLTPRATLPIKGTQDSACFDLSACLSLGDVVNGYNEFNNKTELTVYADPIIREDGEPGLEYSIEIRAGDRVLVPTGLIFDIPRGYCLKMYPRSSTGYKLGLSFPHSVGIIDSDYVDPTFILVENYSDVDVRIVHGQRLAQIMLVKLEEYELTETTVKPTQKTDRAGGYGSTGK